MKTIRHTLAVACLVAATLFISSQLLPSQDIMQHGDGHGYGYKYYPVRYSPVRYYAPRIYPSRV